MGAAQRLQFATSNDSKSVTNMHSDVPHRSNQQGDRRDQEAPMLRRY